MSQLERLKTGQTNLADKVQIGFLGFMGAGFIASAGAVFMFGLSQFNTLLAGLPWPFVGLAGAALVFAAVRCIASGRFFPLVLVALWVAGAGLGVYASSAGPDAGTAFHEMIFGPLLRALPWAFVGVSLLSAALTLGI